MNKTIKFLAAPVIYSVVIVSAYVLYAVWALPTKPEVQGPVFTNYFEVNGKRFSCKEMVPK